MNPGSIICARPAHLPKAQVMRSARKLTSYVNRGETRQAKSTARLLLLSHANRLIAADRAAKSLGLEMTIDDLKTIAERANAFRGTNEPVYCREILKKDGFRRTVCSFGLENRTLQYLVRNILARLCPSKPFMYDVTGKGVSAAVADIKRAGNQGYRWTFCADIIDCYNSVNELALPDHLPLPKDVTRKVLVSGEMNFLRDVHRSSNGLQFPASNLKRPVGIPQGSPTSPLVLRCLIQRLDIALPLGTKLFSFADDFNVMAKTEKECWKAYYALRKFFYEHPAGRFEVRTTVPLRIRQKSGFDFLGYNLRKLPGDWLVTLSTKNRTKLREKWWTALLSDLEGGNSQPIAVREMLLKHRNGMPLWNTYLLEANIMEIQAKKILDAANV